MAGARKRIGKFRAQNDAPGGARVPTQKISLVKPTKSLAEMVQQEMPDEKNSPELNDAQETIDDPSHVNTFADEDIKPEFAKEEDGDTQSLDSVNAIGTSETSAQSSDGQDSAVTNDEAKLQDDDTKNTEKETGGGFRYIQNARAGLSNRKKMLIASAALSIAGIITGAIIALPNFLIHQAKDLLLGKLGDMSSRQQLKYRRSKFARFSDAFSRDGRIGGKMINEMSTKGYRFSYDGNKITSIVTPGGDTITDINQMADHISDYMEVRHPLRTSRWKTRRMEAFANRYGLVRVPPTIRAPDSPEDPDAALNKNMANQTEVDEVETRGLKEELPEDATESDRAAQDASAEAAENSDIFEANKKSLKETGEVVDREALEISESVPDGLNPSLANKLEEVASDGGSVGGEAIDKVKGLTLSGLTDRVCTIKNRIRAGIVAARSFRALAAMKQMLQSVNVSDGLKLKKGDSKMFSSFMKKFTAVDRNGNSIGGSTGMSYILKGRFSKSKNDATRSRVATDGKPTGVIGATWDGLQLPGTSAEACGRWQNPITQILLTTAEVAVGYFTGSSSKVITENTKQSITQLIKKAIENATAKAIAKSIAKTVAFELSFEGIMLLTQWYAEKTMTDNFSSLEVGGMFWDINTSGGGVARKQRDLQAGFVPATTDQFVKAYDEYLAEVKSERKDQSVFARVFDLNNTDSLATSLAWQAPSNLDSVTGAFSGQLASILSSPTSLMSSFTSLFGTKVSAASSDEITHGTYTTEGDVNGGIDLATDPYGNLMTIMREDIASIDPPENEEYLRQNGYIDENNQPIGAFQKHVDNCVNQIDTISVIEGGNASNPEEDCLATQELTVRFKAHLSWLDMTDQTEAEFDPSSISDESTNDDTASDGTSTSAGLVDCQNPQGNEKIVCAAEKYMGIRYSNGGDKWNAEWGVTNTNGRLNGGASAANWLATRVPNGYGDFIDCSGFTNLAMYVAYDYQTTAGCSGLYTKDSNGDGLSDADSNLKIIPIDQVQPGDFLTISQNCNGESAGHIGIFAGVLPSGQWSTIESTAGRNIDGEKKTGYYVKPPGGGTGEHDFKYAARYIGPGSSQ
ncbi:MAG TPA: hypothetical protein PKD20_01235 [Candidatus Saccharibacteria bacterium]|jgi:cell wall-associated NlpC family hydrolase|nr:hypothetical protein [Candidatus Saccharibacteria bacterium]HMT55480.1 hypothetical protein [Candidatus Saccharibacteria bacterium]